MLRDWDMTVSETLAAILNPGARSGIKPRWTIGRRPHRIAAAENPAAVPAAIDDPRYQLAIFPAFLLDTLSEVVAARGIDPAVLCRGLGFTPADLADPGFRVSYRQASLMIQRALKAVPGPGLGIAVGEHNRLGTLGLLGHAVALCGTFGEALEIGARYQVLAGGIAHWQPRHRGDELIVDVDFRFPDPDIGVFCVEELFASFRVYGRALLGAGLLPRRLEFSYPAPAELGAYRRAFGVPLHFCCEANRMVFAAEWSDAPLPNHNALALRQVLQILDRERDALQPLDFAASVERAIVNSLREGPRLERIAADLNLSARSLRRRLAGQGLSFEGLLDNARRTQALGLLANPRRSLDEVAAQAGYGNLRSFRRAFKRWTGLSPGQYRR